ncbi:MAG: hypothetical protein V4610_16320 [Pseudomonadota bacterium]|jgi:hypothetical protein
MFIWPYAGRPERLRRALAAMHQCYAGHIRARLKRVGHFWQERLDRMATDEAHLGTSLRYVAPNPARQPGDTSSGLAMVERSRPSPPLRRWHHGA